MQNLIQNLPIIASGYVEPFRPEKALIYSASPIDRWLCNSVPCYLQVNLGNTYYVTDWSVTGMAGIYGWNTPEYYLNSYILQGSNDGGNWFTIDNGSPSATIGSTQHISSPVQTHYIRLLINSGLQANPAVASVAQFKVFGGLPSSPLLSNLTSSAGILSPQFSPTHNTYTIDVNSSIDHISFIPTAVDPNADITVNGQPVASGYASHNIPLAEASVTNISIVVTPEIGDPYTYTIDVTRASNAYLSNMTFIPVLAITPAFNQTTFSYTATTDRPAIRITPTAVDPNATITVNGTTVASSSPAAVSLVDGSNTVTIEVTPSYGSAGQTYILSITKTS